MSTRNDAITRVSRKIQDIGSGASGSSNVELTDTDIGEEVDAAVTQYSLDRPRIRVADVTSQTSPYINVTNLTGWVNEWSVVRRIEWQAAAVSATYNPTLLDLQDDVQLYRDASNVYLYLPHHTPASGDTTRITYTTPHTLDANTDTIPTPHFDAVCDLAAAFSCRRLASQFSKSSDSTIASDSVNYRDSQLRFKQTAEDFEKQYRRKIGLTDGTAPAGGIFDFDTNYAWGSDRLLHPRRWR